MSLVAKRAELNFETSSESRSLVIRSTTRRIYPSTLPVVRGLLSDQIRLCGGAKMTIRRATASGSRDCNDGALTGLVMCRLCFGTPERGAAITMIRCHDLAVSECQLLDALVRGIELQDCVRCRVSSNSIIDRRQQHSMIHAIRVTGNSVDNLIQNNLIGGATDAPIVASDTAAVVRGNTLLE